MDFVANHTSDRHAWFQRSRQDKNNEYRNYYYWSKDPVPAWRSVFGGAAWELDERTGEYYLHSFAEGQPDLNWTNARVREELRSVIDFWIEKGVDGFRCDVLDFIAKDFDRKKMYEGKDFHRYVNELFGRENCKGLFTIGECKSAKAAMKRLCGEERGELTTIFQFDHIRLGRKDKFSPATTRLDGVRKTLSDWQAFTQENDLIYTLFTDNHDEPFYLSRFISDEESRYPCATMLAAMFFLLRGVPVLFQGQEYGRINSYHADFSQFDDVETKNFIAEKRGKLSDKKILEKINRGSRDNPRRPMAWTAEPPNFGFSEQAPWLAAHSAAERINLQTDERAEKSVFRFYQRLFAFRKESEAVRYGSFKDLTEGEGRFVYERQKGTERVTVVCNFEKEQSLTEKWEGELIFSNYADRTDKAPRFRAYETAVYRKK